MEAGKTNSPLMNYLTEDLWAIIISRLPLKIITTSQLVCKQWKSIVESPLFRQIFLSHHQNSHSSWSLMWRGPPKEVVGHYECKVWGLPRSLGSYISSFIAKKFKSMSCPKEKVRVESYTDVGLILFSQESFTGELTYYVANPISQQCVDIPPPLPHRPTCKAAGLATRIENGFVLGYKIVVIDKCNMETGDISLLIYSSETGLWGFDTLHSPLPLAGVVNFDPVSLNGNLYWLGFNLNHERVIVYHNLYATGTESNRCRVILLPDSEYENELDFIRSCTTCQGSLIYMNIVPWEMEDKLRVWRLKSGEWQLVSDISPAPYIKIGFEFFPLVINPFDGNKIYMWSKVHKCMAIMKLHKGKLGHYSILERSKDGRILSCAGPYWDTMGNRSLFSTFVLPRWLYRIPSPPS